MAEEDFAEGSVDFMKSKVRLAVFELCEEPER
jgi:hypothetical protein